MKIIIVLIILILVSALASSLKKEYDTLKCGDQAPDFMLSSHDNEVIRLSDYRGEYVVLYFFPKAETPGWTKQACGFRDLYSEYKNNNINVLGISYDSMGSLLKFKNKYSLPFTFLSDTNKKVSKLFGAEGKLWPSRITFLIDPNGTIKRIYKKVNVSTHSEKILDDIKNESPSYIKPFIDNKEKEVGRELPMADISNI